MLLWLQGVGVDAQVDTDLPVSLAGVVGKTYTFLSEHLRPYQPLIYMYVFWRWIWDFNFVPFIVIYSCLRGVFHRTVEKSQRRFILEMCLKKLMARLVTLALVQISHQRPLLQVISVHSRPKPILMLMKMQGRRLMWDETSPATWTTTSSSISSNALLIFTFHFLIYLISFLNSMVIVIFYFENNWSLLLERCCVSLFNAY